jgi:hypothetical protein
MLRATNAIVMGTLVGGLMGCSAVDREGERVGASGQRLTTEQEQKLVSPGAGPYEAFGNAVALVHDTAIIGSREDDFGQGSAYLFQRSGATWSFQQKLTAGAGRRTFGASVAIFGDTAVANSFQPMNSRRGSAHVFRRVASEWVEEAVLVPDPVGVGEGFGHPVALFENTLITGGDVVDIFVRNGTAWTLQQRLPVRGTAVALSGDTALVGDPDADVGSNADQGHVRVFNRAGSVWTEQQQLAASDGGIEDRFGNSVAISGDVVWIGDANDQIDGSRRGSAYVFRRSSTTQLWTEEQKVTNSDGVDGDRFGSSFAIAGDLAVIGASLHEHGGINENHGSAYVFIRSGSAWVEDRELRASDGQNNDFFGASLAFSENTLLVGADNDDVPQPAQGAAYTFVFRGALGDPCGGNSGCDSGFCVDGRCCNSACEGSCNACSITAGATLDGECTLLPAGAPGSPACAPFSCSGSSPTCQGTGSNACVRVSEHGDDAAALASNGAVPFRNIQPAIDFADSNRQVATSVCIAGDFSCVENGAFFPGPVNAPLTMRSGISVIGGFESTNWTSCESSTPRIVPQTAEGLLFPPELTVETKLERVNVKPAAFENAAAITIDGARGVVLDRAAVSTRSSWPSSFHGETLVGVDIKGGAEVTIQNSNVTVAQGEDVVGLRSVGSRVVVSRSTFEAVGPGLVQAALVVDSPGSTFDSSYLHAHDAYPGSLATVEAFSVRGDASGVVLQGATVVASGGYGSAAIAVDECAGTAALIDSNYVDATGSDNYDRIGIWGIRTAADCPTSVTANEVRIDLGEGEHAVGIECGSGSRLIDNFVEGTNFTLRSGSRGELVGVSCTDCLEISENDIAGINSIALRDDLEHHSVGLLVTGSGTLIDANSIDGGCSGDRGSIGISASGSLRIQNNLIAGGHDCEGIAPTSYTTGIEVHGPDVDIHSNYVDSGQPAIDPCTAVGIHLNDGATAAIRNNIIELGACAGGAHIVEATTNADPTVLENNAFVPRAVGEILYVDQGTLDPSTAAAVNALPDIPSSGNFSAACGFPLALGSACIDSGTTAGAPALDIDGQSRSATLPDVGPDEWSDVCPPGITGVNCELVFTDVEVGQGFSCGLRSDGQILCWGDNDYGQTAAPSGTFRALSAGHRAAGALRSDGTIACWGSGNQDVLSPHPGTFDQIVAQSDYACALHDTIPTCWGFYSHDVPDELFSLVEIGAWHSCGLRPDGTVGCWGLEGDPNDEGQANPPTGTFRALGLSVWASCGIRQSDGFLQCWGRDIFAGNPPPPRPLQAVDLNFLGTGCALELDGRIMCFGTSFPAPPEGTFKSLAMGPYHACAIHTDDRLTCWGQNVYGESTPPY